MKRERFLNMAKRIVTKIGNIFSLEIDGEYKCYFQYIANDRTQLNSSVIRVFKKHYELHENPSMDEIVKDEISFYAHTILKGGIQDGIWNKVGTHSDVGDNVNVYFRTFGAWWTCWKINNPFQSFKECGDFNNPPVECLNMDEGSVYPYSYIICKVKTGYFLPEPSIYGRLY